MSGKLKDLFIPFCQKPRVAHSALKRGIVLNRGRCEPAFKKEVQLHNVKLKKVTRLITHGTAASHYSDIAKKSLAVQMETVIFFCRYADDGLVAKLARKGKAGRQAAEFLADATYYWDTIGKPITREWLKFGFKAAMPLAKFGLTGNIPDSEPAFSMDSFMDGVPKLSALPQVKGFVDKARNSC